MEKKVCWIVLLVLFLFTYEVMLKAEARSCYSRSRKYHGRCFFKNQQNNCKTICRDEKFTAGKCVRGTCYCATKCSTPTHPPPPPPAPSGGGDDEPGTPGDGGEDGEA